MGNTKRILKSLALLCAIISGLAVCLYFSLLAINWHDQPPSNVALQFDAVSTSNPPLADENNGYVFMLGFSVPKSEDPTEWGQKRIAWAHQEIKKSPAEFSSEFPGENYDFTHNQSASIRALLDACKTVDRSCLSSLEKSDQSLGEWLEAEDWVLSRYRALLAHSGWQETAPLDARLPLPRYSDVFVGQKLLLIKAWLAAGQGDAVGVNKLLEEDEKYWRATLAASDVLISKMISVAALQRHFIWSNVILRRLPVSVIATTVPASWSAPISDTERSMKRCFVGEWKYATAILWQAKRGVVELSENALEKYFVARLFLPLLQPQDSSNRYAVRLSTIDEMLRVPFAQFPDAVMRVREFGKEHIASVFPSRAYNIGGDYLESSNAVDFATYAVRATDLEGLRRIAMLAANLRSRAVPVQEVAKELTTSDFRNPYTGHAFVWDEKRAAIMFTGLEPGERGTFFVLF